MIAVLLGHFQTNGHPAPHDEDVEIVFILS